MGAAGGFGRRASDGGANLQKFFQKHTESNEWAGAEEHRHHIDPTLQVSNPVALNNPTNSTGFGAGQTQESFEEATNSMDVARFYYLNLFVISLSNLEPLFNQVHA